MTLTFFLVAITSSVPRHAARRLML